MSKIQDLIDAAKALREETNEIEKVQISGLDSILFRSKNGKHIDLKACNEPELFKRIADALTPTVAQKKEICRENDKKLAEVEKMLKGDL
jgi:hypothetical protein